MQRKDPFVIDEYYHIYNRGVDKRVIFENPYDYKRFLMLLYISNSNESIKLDTLLRYQKNNYDQILEYPRGKNLVSIGAWCLMPNHFHLLLKENVQGGISKFMSKLGTGYSMYFNSKNDRKGTLFSGPFRSKNVSEDSYMQHLFGYIHLNPLDLQFSDWEADINNGLEISIDAKNFLKAYPYSSYPDWSNEERVESIILDKLNFPEYFKGNMSFDSFISNYLINP